MYAILQYTGVVGITVQASSHGLLDASGRSLCRHWLGVSRGLDFSGQCA